MDLKKRHVSISATHPFCTFLYTSGKQKGVVRGTSRVEIFDAKNLQHKEVFLGSIRWVGL
jgi:hypothetical protein